MYDLNRAARSEIVISRRCFHAHDAHPLHSSWQELIPDIDRDHFRVGVSLDVLEPQYEQPEAIRRGVWRLVSNDTYLRRAMAQTLRDWKARLQNVTPLLCLHDWSLVESSRERSWHGHSVQVETVGEFRCLPRGEFACRFQLAIFYTGQALS